jgi:hypothetical protein
MSAVVPDDVFAFVVDDVPVDGVIVMVLLQLVADVAELSSNLPSLASAAGLRPVPSSSDS